MPDGVFEAGEDPVLTEQQWSEQDAPAADLPRRTGRLVAFGLVVLLLAAAGGLGAAAVLERRAAVYHAEAVLLIDEEPALTASGDDGILNKLTRLRIKYVDLVHTTTFADTLSSSLNLSGSRVHAALGATAPISSLLLSVTADDGNAGDAQRIAEGAAELLRDQLRSAQEGIGVKPDKQVTFTVVSPAKNGVKTAPSRQRSVIVGAVVFVALLAGGLILLEVPRRRRS